MTTPADDHAGDRPGDAPRSERDYRVTGDGSPVTVFAHGLGGSIAETRPFGSGVAGRRVFFTFPGHGPTAPNDNQPDGGWDYPMLSAELDEVAALSGATRAVGVSMGAGALLRLVARTPNRFDRLVFVLPSALDDVDVEPTEGGEVARAARFARLARLADAGDREGLTAALLDEQPEPVRDRPDVLEWARGQAQLLSRPSLAQALRELPTTAPMQDRSLLADCAAPALVLAAEDDPAHPVRVARDLAAALPRARLEVLGAGGLLWTHRRRVRELISGFLNGAGE